MALPSNPSRRVVYTILLASTIVCFTFISIFRNMSQGTRHPDYAQLQSQAATHLSSSHQSLSPDYLSSFSTPGTAIAPKLGNETLKAELGRAAWKLFHTTFARFPDTPTDEESAALLAYVYLFQRLYPCGECAGHFGEILKRYPPQVSSRSTAAAWGCHVHNEVNKSLGKEIFDCSNIGDFYDCGCAEDADAEDGDGLTAGSRGHTVREPAGDEMEPAKLTVEEWQRGG